MNRFARILVGLVLAAAAAAGRAGRARLQDGERRRHRDGRPALAGGLPRRRDRPRQREAGRRRGRRRDEGRVLASDRARSAARRSCPSCGRSVAKDGQIYGNADAGSSVAGHQRLQVLLPRLQRDHHRRGRPAHRQERVRPESQRVGLRVVERHARAPRARRRRRRLGRVPGDLQPRAQPPADADRVGHARSRPAATPQEELLNTLYRTTTHEFSDMPWDAFLQQTLLDYVATEQAAPALRRATARPTSGPTTAATTSSCSRRTTWTDSSASCGRRCRRCPQYKDKTTFIITTDHGRGDGPENWKHHDWNVEGAENMWIAVLGPGHARRSASARTPRGSRRARSPRPSRRLLGKDWQAFNPKAAPPLAEAIAGRVGAVALTPAYSATTAGPGRVTKKRDCSVDRGKRGRVALGPAAAERIGRLRPHERPDAAAESPAEGRGRGRPELARQPRERDRLGDLVAEACSASAWERSTSSPDQADLALFEQIPDGGNDADRLLQELVEPRREELRARTRPPAAGAAGSAAASGASGRRRERGEERSRRPGPSSGSRARGSPRRPARGGCSARGHRRSCRRRRRSTRRRSSSRSRAASSARGARDRTRTGRSRRRGSTRIAVWSSLPPNVPTPRSPPSAPKRAAVLEAPEVSAEVLGAADARRRTRADRAARSRPRGP